MGYRLSILDRSICKSASPGHDIASFLMVNRRRLTDLDVRRNNIFRVQNLDCLSSLKNLSLGIFARIGSQFLS